MLDVQTLLDKYADAPFVVLSDFDGYVPLPPSIPLYLLRARRADLEISLPLHPSHPLLKRPCDRAGCRTISTEDSNDHVIDLYGMGETQRRKVWEKVVTGEDGANFRDAFKESLDSVAEKLSFPQTVDILRKGASFVLALLGRAVKRGSDRLPSSWTPCSHQARPGLHVVHQVLRRAQPPYSGHPRIVWYGAYHQGHPG